MIESKTDADKEALKSWYKTSLDNVVKEMLRVNAVTGVALEAAPIWAVPNQILIAKVWSTNQKKKFIWTISGERVITDHFPGSLAATPKDAARHFSFKWQMDADRLVELAKNKKGSEAHMDAYSKKLIQDAELLYDLTQRDAIWL